jgi:hypothetical protein
MNLTQVLENKYKLNNGIKFDDHEMVKSFNSIESFDSKNKDLMIEAYICRDIQYSGNLTVVELFQKHIKKLGYNPTSDELLNRNKYKLINKFKSSLMNNKEANITSDFLKDIVDNIYTNCIDFTQEDISNRDRALKILKMAESGEHITKIYNEFTLDELGYIGW